MNIDIHSHSVQRPYGKSFGALPTKKSSLWYKTRLHFLLKWFTQYFSFAKFTQSDFTSQVYGNTAIVFVSLYPIEKEFFKLKPAFLNKFGINVLLGNFVTSLGRNRIKAILQTTDYGEGFEKEYDFLRSAANVPVTIDGVKWQYRIATGFNEMNLHINDAESEHVIFIIPTVEGLHILNKSLIPATDETTILASVNKIKQTNPLLFVSLAHHFWNGLCGHSPSLNSGYTKYFLNQSLHINEGMQQIGYKVVDALLSTENGKRIQIDVKHMSVQARIEYYAYIESRYPEDEIPVIVSHGSCNGLEKPGKKYITAGMDKTALLMKNEPLNIYDEELIRIARTNGIFGIQLDKKRLVHPDYDLPEDISFLVWNQIEHIAVLLDRNRLPCWHIQAIGSDHDGIINPLNPYFTAAELPALKLKLSIHLKQFLNDYNFYVSENKLPADTIIEKIFFGNAWAFLKRYW
jgi:hypothetical protein